jgi:hypothetical protein
MSSMKPAQRSSGSCKACGPAEKGALDAHREGQGNIGHQFRLAARERAAHQIRDDFPADGFEGIHPFRSEIPLDDSAIGRVLRGIHSIGYGKVLGHRVAERVVIVDHAGNVLVPEQRPLHELAVGDGAAFAHSVVARTLIAKNILRSRIPIRCGFSHYLSNGCYRPIKINTPAAIARIAMRVPTPEKLRLSSGSSPPNISQIASKSMPRFLVSLIAILSPFSFSCVKKCRPDPERSNIHRVVRAHHLDTQIQTSRLVR